MQRRSMTSDESKSRSWRGRTAKRAGTALRWAVLGGVLGTVAYSQAATNDELQGTDTMGVLIREVLRACPDASPLVYIGGGSSGAEQRMVEQEQEVAPMSRPLRSSRACRTQDPAVAHGFEIALQAFAVGEDAQNGQCGQAPGIAEGGECFAVGDGEYCFADAVDALRIVYSGQMGPDGERDCASDVRAALLDDWGALHAGDCDEGNCAQLAHAFRPDEYSGTTDLFLSLLDLPDVSDEPFCNGWLDEDLDPVRRPCGLDDDVCSADGTSGVVLPVSVPDLPPTNGQALYPEAACAPGQFRLARAMLTQLPHGTVRFDCPERGNFGIAGFCLAPVTEEGHFDCLSPPRNPNVFFQSLEDDARLFNRWLRYRDGELARSVTDLPVTSAWYRLRTGECQMQDSDTAAACLAKEYDCTMAVAPIAAFDPAITSPLAIDAVAPALPNIQDRSYPMTRSLRINSLVGFEIHDALESAMIDCLLGDAQILADAVDGASFTGLGTPPQCEDFDETTCNSLSFDCDTSFECGGFPCTGGQPSTYEYDGQCDFSCNTTADCLNSGRECVDGQCRFVQNTDACSSP